MQYQNHNTKSSMYPRAKFPIQKWIENKNNVNKYQIV